MMALGKRYRLRFSFWLNILNPDEELIADEIELLKNERSFARACRDGIMLISDLRKGRSDQLIALFDWLRAPLELYQSLIEGETSMLYHLFPDIAPKPMPPPAPPKEVDELKQRITILESEVDLLRGILIKQQSPGAVDTAVKMTSADGVTMVDMPGQGAPVRTPRPPIAKLPIAPPVVVEVDTSSSFLDMF